MIIAYCLLLAKNFSVFEQLYRSTATGQVKQISAMMPLSPTGRFSIGSIPLSSIFKEFHCAPFFPVRFLPFHCVFLQFSGSIFTIDLI